MRRPIAAAILAESATDAMVDAILPSPVPKGWELVNRVGDGAWYRASNGLALCLTVAHEDDGKRWIHLTVSRVNRLPSWDELVAARDAFLGSEALCVQVLAPKSRHVNIHPYCLHLWRCLDGDPVPDFARGGGVDMSRDTKLRVVPPFELPSEQELSDVHRGLDDILRAMSRKPRAHPQINQLILSTVQAVGVDVMERDLRGKGGQV